MAVKSEEERHLLPSAQRSATLPPSVWNRKTFAMLFITSLCLTWPLFALTSGRSSINTRQDQKVIAAYTAPSAFPTSAFSSYYSSPSGTLYEPRPAITEYAAGHAFSPSVDQPYPLPTGPPSYEAVYPEAKEAAPRNYSSQIEFNINSIIGNTSLTSCQKCVRSMQQGQLLARANPKSVPGVLTDLCTMYKFESTASGLNQSEVCKRTYSGATLGAQYSQILSYIDLTKGDDSRDALFLCNLLLSSQSNCSKPAPLDLNADGFLDNWFGGKTKREEKRQRGMTKRSTASGPARLDKRGKKKMLKVLHVSESVIYTAN